jgi:hypothetical protein
MRLNKSEMPPGAAGQTMRTGLSGNVCAHTLEQATNAHAQTVARTALCISRQGSDILVVSSNMHSPIWFFSIFKF